MPTGDTFPYWEAVITLAGFGLLWWKTGKDAGKSEQANTNTKERVDKLAEDMNTLETEVDLWAAREYCTPVSCKDRQDMCQQHTWDRLMLALEKRDRDFDKKFATICSGITEIKSRLPRRSDFEHQ